jgi:quinol monooxygenase YgiN
MFNRTEPRGTEEMPTASAGGQKLAHIVFFTLKESTPANQKKLVDACHRYLTGHPGVASFYVGTLADYARDVNVRDFDVCLQLVFENRAAHDAYQAAPRHKQFAEENKATWHKPRVFDVDLVEGQA